MRDYRLFFLEEVGEGRGPSRDNIPCNSLADAVNLPCGRSHSNAGKLDAVLVYQCFTQCLVVTREDLSSLQFFLPRGPRSSTRVQVFVHAAIRVRRATDRDLESQCQKNANALIRARRQPTAIMRGSASFCVSAWICAPRATDRDLASKHRQK